MTGRIHQLNCSRGGVPKLPVEEALLTPTGLACDAQADTRHHGGPERALCLYSLEHIRALQSEGHPIRPGTAGENVTLEGLDWHALEPGSRMRLGDEALIEISGYATPCRVIAASFAGGEFKRILQKTHPGESRLYARVLQTGRLAVGQRVEVIT